LARARDSGDILSLNSENFLAIFVMISLYKKYF